MLNILKNTYIFVNTINKNFKNNKLLSIIKNLTKTMISG